jgi:membrane protein implicated in regulation of membrane protease activity
MNTFGRYVLLQVPGWLFAALAVIGLYQWKQISFRVAAALLVLWVVKDFVYYPLVRTAYEGTVRTGAERLIGSVGLAKGRLAPRGYVQIRGELWRAEADTTDREIPPGSNVRVIAARGLTLTVTPDPPIKG